MPRHASRFVLALGLIWCCAVNLAGAAATVYVDVSNTSGVEDGTPANPWRSIQAGIDATTGLGDLVLVAPGTYLEAILVKDGIALRCTTAPLCVIDGNSRGRSVVVFLNTKNYPVIEGFTITGGAGDYLGTAEDGTPVHVGGGLRVQGAAVVRNNVIENNVLRDGICQGGGIFVSPLRTSPQIVGNVIRNNAADCAKRPDLSRGGGIYLVQKFSETIVEDNVIESNRSRVGGGIYAVSQGDSALFVQRNVFQLNEAPEGGAIYAADIDGTKTTIASNLFFGNGSVEGTLDCDDADPTTGPGLPELCDDGKDNDCNAATPDLFDADGDGALCDVDCDDADPLTGPLAIENCSDGVDNDCDGLVDAAEPSCQCGDADADGFSCEDCNDSDPLVNPAASEVCNDGKDNDCDPATPDLVDADGDGYNCAIDCDDQSAAIRPGAVELHCDGVDNDCNPGTPDVVDADNDQYNCLLDCNDASALINPSRFEFCEDGVDNDCDGFVDGQDFACSCDDPGDLDGDGFRCDDCDDTNAGINPVANEICNDGRDNDCKASTPDIFDGDGDGFDCDEECRDFDPAVFPGAPEICNDGLDNDCDGAVDLADTECACPDVDNDGYRCSDCNDANPTTHPGAPELCNDGADNDCNPLTPDVGDADGDGVNCLTDCDDSNASIYPQAAEQCKDRLDNDCDGLIDVLRPSVNLVAFGSPMVYRWNLSNPGIGITWVQRAFDDSTWFNGLYGVGYQRGGGGAHDLIVTDVPDGSASVYTRATFIVEDPGGVNQLLLGADFDDAYVAWINGVEIYRSPQMPAGTPTWNVNPAQHESSNAAVPNYGTLIDISAAAIPLLVPGENLLAVGLYNNIPATNSSSDLVVVPLLRMSYGADDPDCTACPDDDGDGYACDDCDDYSSQINPGMAEIGCNLFDDDCDLSTDDSSVDADGDGYDCAADCNDELPQINPGAAEIGCNAFDDDCDSRTSDILDADADGIDCALDCDDEDPERTPGRAEVACDGIDNDCNTLTSDNIDADKDSWTCASECDDSNPAIRPDAAEKCDDLVDNDCDGLVDAADPECACPDADGDGYACGDCDETNPAVNPGTGEICDDGLDNDCNAETLDVGDADGDGVSCLTDCDDSNRFVKPGGLEFCNDGLDNDCDPATPDLFDADGDGYDCVVDCRDDIAAIHPGAVEICADGADNDCSGATPDLFDADGDGYHCAFDCDDGNPAVHPGVAEICNDGLDNDCNPATLDLFDADGDGVDCATDCNDGAAGIYPGAFEQCLDTLDNDCDGLVDLADPDCACGDADGDGYDCAADCDNTNPAINPGAVEVCDDGVDNDCDPLTPDLGDLDGDGYDCSLDCLDSDAGINPGAPELCADGVDNDCSAATPDLFDLDGDGYACDVDCDDGEPTVHPGASEITCDGIDNDCSVLTIDLADGDGDSVACADLSIRGGAVASWLASDGELTLINNTFIQNSVPSGIGGAVWIDGTLALVPSLVGNNIFAGNGATAGGAVDHTLFSGVILRNDLFDNLGGDLYNGGGSQATLSGNLYIDPGFKSAATGNYQLRADSQLVDAVAPGPSPSFDVDGFRRPFDGDGDGLAVADIGAYESPSGEVFGLVFVGPDELSWEVRDGENFYNVYRGDMDRLHASGNYTQALWRPNVGQFCRLRANDDMPLADPFVPRPGELVYYLVTLTNSRKSYEGTLGDRTDGQLRRNAFPCE